MMQSKDIPQALRIALYNLQFAQNSVTVAMEEVNRQMALLDHEPLPSFPHPALDAHPPGGGDTVTRTFHTLSPVNNVDMSAINALAPWGVELNDAILELTTTVLGSIDIPVEKHHIAVLRNEFLKAYNAYVESAENAGDNPSVELNKHLTNPARRNDLLAYLTEQVCRVGRPTESPSGRQQPWPESMDIEMDKIGIELITELNLEGEGGDMDQVRAVETAAAQVFRSIPPQSLVDHGNYFSDTERRNEFKEAVIAQYKHNASLVEIRAT